MDNDGKCHLNLHDDDENSSKTWKCGLTCRTFESEDRQSIIDLKNDFSFESVEKVRDVLEKLDNGCEHGHYSKAYDADIEESSDESSCGIQFEELKAHPLPCSSGCCSSRLRMLQAGAVDYPVLRTLLNNVYRARRNDNDITQIETGLSEGSIHYLKNNLKLQDLSVLLDDEDSSTAEVKSLSTSESHIEVEFADIIEEFYEKLKQDPEFTCCSCERLLVRKALTHFNFTTEKFKSSTWVQLKNYLLEKDPDVDKDIVRLYPLSAYFEQK